MSIVPTWPIAVGALVIGFAGGFAVEHTRLGAKIDRINADIAETERQRQLVRADDERVAREREQAMAARAGQIEQEKQNEIAAVRSSADALIERLRKQAASKPTSTGRVPAPGAACPAQPGPDIPLGSGERIVRLAERADAIRAGLAACYKWADSVEERVPEEPREGEEGK